MFLHHITETNLFCIFVFISTSRSIYVLFIRSIIIIIIIIIIILLLLYSLQLAH